MELDYTITYRLKDKGWQYIISQKLNGKWKQVKSKQGFAKKSDAKPEAEKALEELKKSSAALNIPEELKNITFKNFSKQYLEHSKLYNENKTIQSTQTVLNNFSALNDMILSDINTIDIQKVVDAFVKNGLKPNTIKYYLKKLTIIFNSAKNQYELINTIPTKKIIIGKMNEIHKRALDDNEVNKLLSLLNKKCTNKYKNKYYLLFYIAVNTGMRIGEILGLKWDDIDTDQHIISVSRQWKLLRDGSYGFGELKTKNSKRIIPISTSFEKNLLSFNKVINMNGRVLNFKDKSGVIGYANKLLKKYGYDISFHELRHTYATKLISNGMDFKTAAQILGHDVQQTIKTYSHVNNDMLKKAKNLIENIF